MQILYRHDMRSVAVYAVLVGRNVRWIVSHARGEPEDWEVEALARKDRRPVVGIDYWWRYLGVAPEHKVTCRLREPVGGNPKGTYPFEELRLVIRGPEQVLVMPCPTNEAAWRQCLLWVYTTMLDAAVFREGRLQAIKKANARWRKRVAKRRAAAQIRKSTSGRRPTKGATKSQSGKRRTRV